MTIVVNTIDPVRVPTLYPRAVTLSGSGLRYPGDNPSKQVDVFVDGVAVSKLPLYSGQNHEQDLRFETQPHAAGFVDLTLSKFRGFTEVSAFGPACIALAASSDLQHLVKFSYLYDEYAYISHDAGVTWTTYPLSNGSIWGPSVISDDGQVIGVVRDFTGVDRHLLFSFNGGTSWSELGPRKLWGGLAISRDGAKIYSAEGLNTNNSEIRDPDGTLRWTGEGYLYRSLDGGATFVPCTVLDNFVQVDCSYNGSVVVATTYQGRIYVSSDSGDTWQVRVQPEEAGWPIVSGDGSTIFFRHFTGSSYNFNRLYRSTDAGVTWELVKEQTYLGTFYVDYTGQTMLWDRFLGGTYYLSQDGGATWQYLTSLNNGALLGCVVSSSGSKFAIIGNRTDAVNKYLAFEISEANPLLDTLTIPDAIEFYTSMVITGLDPDRGPLAGGNIVTIHGEGFYQFQAEGEGIWFGDTYAGFGTFVDSNTLTVEAPAGQSPGPVLLSLRPANNDAVEPRSYYYEGMAITDVNPAFGPLSGGNTVTISGSGFYALQQEAGIWFGSVYAGHGTFVDANTYTVDAPPSAVAGPVLVSIQTPNDYAEFNSYAYGDGAATYELYMDGFDYYGAEHLPTKYFVDGFQIAHGSGQDGGGALEPLETPYLELPQKGIAPRVLGFSHYRYPEAEQGSGWSLRFSYDPEAAICSVEFTADGHIQVVGGGDTLESNNTLPLDKWSYIEVGFTLDTIEVRVNGSSVGWIPESPRTNAEYYDLIIAATNATYRWMIDHLYVCWGAPLKWFGKCQVKPLELDGNSTPQEWTASADPAWEQLTDFPGGISTEQPATAMFTVSDLSSSPNSPLQVFGVQVNMTGQDTFQQSLPISVVFKTPGGSHTTEPTSLPEYLYELNEGFLLDPSTGYEFTLDDLSSLEVGVASFERPG